jgi:hypothetical protein
MKTNVIVTNVHPKKFGFCVTADTGEQAFIPPHVVNAIGAEAGNEYFATMVPNPNRETAQRTAFQVVKLEPADAQQFDLSDDVEPEPGAISDDLSAKISQLLKDDGGAMDTASIATEFGFNSRRMGAHLLHMHNKGKICRVEYWAKGTQKRASYVFWSYNLSNVLD